MDAYSKYLQLSGSLRNATCEVELVTRTHAADGTTSETSNFRRAVCKKITRQQNKTILNFADVDLAALDKPFPFETYTVEDFPGLYVEHVGRRICQACGDVRKVPLTWIATSGGVWTFAALNTTGLTSVTLRAVYRGSQPGQGALVDVSEYTTGTAVGGSTGVNVYTVNFTQEQKDFQGRPYVLEADYYALPSVSQTPSGEIYRILGLYGISADATSFLTNAATNDVAISMFVGALYGDPGKNGRAIINDLLQLARGWLVPLSNGSWGLVQDVAQASVASFDTAADQIQIDEFGDGDIPATVTIEYSPKSSAGTDWGVTLSLATVGVNSEKRLTLPYATKEYVGARNLLSYWQNRLNSLVNGTAKASVYGVHLSPGTRITISDTVHYNGSKDWIVDKVTRSADRNVLTLRKYDATIYSFTPPDLPAGASNTYSPDYSFTPPATPTGLTVVSQGTSSDTDGKTVAYALIRATPPSVNWEKLMVVVVDTTTNEQYIFQLLLNAGNYEVTVSGLRPARAHTVKAWAVNSNNVEGALTSPVSFTSANYTTQPAAPSSVAVRQTQSFQVELGWARTTTSSNTPPVVEYVIFEKVGAAAFAEKARIRANDSTSAWVRTNVTHGTTYQYKLHSVDQNGNESSDSSTVSITPAAVITDSYVVPVGISGLSIADGSINRSRSNTATGSSTGSLASGAAVNIGMTLFTFFPQIYSSLGLIYVRAATVTTSDDAGEFRLKNDGGVSDSYETRWRNFQT